jgi:hypothetical protein
MEPGSRGQVRERDRLHRLWFLLALDPKGLKSLATSFRKDFVLEWRKVMFSLHFTYKRNRK